MAAVALCGSVRVKNGFKVEIHSNPAFFYEIPFKTLKFGLRSLSIMVKRPLKRSIENPNHGHRAADAAAFALGLSRRQVYVLIRRAREGAGLVTDLAPERSGGGRGKGRLSEPVERIIRELLQKRFLTRQKRSLAAFHREVVHACKVQKLPVPTRNTIALRIARLDPEKTIRSREGLDGARDLQGVGGVPPTITAPGAGTDRRLCCIKALTGNILFFL